MNFQPEISILNSNANTNTQSTNYFGIQFKRPQFEKCGHPNYDGMASYLKHYYTQMTSQTLLEFYTYYEHRSDTF